MHVKLIFETQRGHRINQTCKSSRKSNQFRPYLLSTHSTSQEASENNVHAVPRPRRHSRPPERRQEHQAQRPPEEERHPARHVQAPGGGAQGVGGGQGDEDHASYRYGRPELSLIQNCYKIKIKITSLDLR